MNSPLLRVPSQTGITRCSSLVFLLFAGLTLVGCTTPQPPPAALPGELPKVVTPVATEKAHYSRSLQTEPDTYVMQTGLRVFKPASGSGPEIELLGAVHIGETSYYQELQKRMDASPAVLFEQVSDETKSPDSMTAEEKKEALEDSAYQKLANLMGIVCQTAHISYKAKHFERCDMTVQQMRALLDTEIASGGQAAKDAKAAQKEFSKLFKILQGDSWLVNFAFWVAGMSDNLKAQLKLMLVIGAGQDQEGKDKSLHPRLSKLITEDRNNHVIRELSRLVKERPTVKRFTVFYGAAHLPGMEKSLLEMGYLPAGPIEWLNAVTSHPFAEGLDQQDVKSAIKRAQKDAK